MLQGQMRTYLGLLVTHKDPEDNLGELTFFRGK